MTFIWPSLLVFLLCVPLLLWVYFRMQQRRRNYASQFGTLGLLRNAKGKAPGGSRLVPTAFFLGGIAILIFSTARPQANVSLPRLEGTVILTFDVSGSMVADDLKPSRMEAAKTAASQFVKNQPSGVSIGVVAFSDGGIAVQPPTNDHAKTLDTISRLVPHRGTSIANGVLVALNSIIVNAGDPPILKTSNNGQPQQSVETPQGWYPSSVIVLLSDGENNQNPDPMQAADLAADLGVRVYTVGIGSTAGATITVEGYIVHSQLDEQLMQGIAADTGGKYYNASNEGELFKIYNDLKPKLYIKKEQMEVTSIFAGLGMLTLLVGSVLSLLWFGRVP